MTEAVSRRRFLAGSAAFAALGSRAFAGTPDGLPLLRLGVLSDLHIRDGFGSGADTQFGTETLVRALRWYAEQGVDAVAICGDMADLGTVAQLQHVADAWDRVFPNGKAADGRPVEKVFIYGNHDMDGFTYGLKGTRAEQEARFAASIARDPAAAWEACFHEPFEPLYTKTVKGIPFVGCHWDYWKLRTGTSRRIGEYVTNVAKRFDPNLPCFYLQHPHVRNTCFGPTAWGHDEGHSNPFFEKLPNLVALSGHAHYSMTDELAVWQEGFTSIGVGSLSYLTQRLYRENGEPWNGYQIARQMDPHEEGLGPLTESRHGLMVSVYKGGAVAVSRRDFHFNESLGDDWTFEVPAPADRSYTFAVRGQRAKSSPPKFPDRAKLQFSLHKGKARGIPGSWHERQRQQLRVGFPAAHAGKSRVFEYDVMVEELVADFTRVLREKRVIAPDYSMPRSRLRQRACCDFSFYHEVPAAGRLKVTVWPMDSFGNRGEPLVETANVDVNKLPACS